VEEGNLTQYISHLRKALGDNSEDTRLIVTIARKGYHFTGNVGAVPEAGDISKRTPVRIPATESRQTDISPSLSSQRKRQFRKHNSAGGKL